MALIQWKQLDTALADTVYTGSFNVTGSILLNGVDLSIDESIFKQTGSYWNTTRNIGITGSLQVQLNGTTDYFAINIAGEEKVKINTEGVVQLAPLEETPSAVAGGLFYSASDAFYVGLVNS
jgi:hypothetical protein